MRRSARSIGAALTLALCLTAGAGGGAAPERVVIPAGSFTPLYALDPGRTEVAVGRFALDRRPVTNAQFLAFTKAHPQWRRGAAAPLFVDEGYLAHWASPSALGEGMLPDQPVTEVSWFAAKAYCEARGARLPTELEWEYAASASESAADGRAEPGWTEQILAWYGRPASQALPRVGQGRPNFYGVEDLHGLVWEWVLEFNSTLVSSDSRDGGRDATRFCGGGAISAGDKADYASFMRYAFRSSLEARYTARSLGFRCAADVGPGR